MKKLANKELSGYRQPAAEVVDAKEADERTMEKKIVDFRLKYIPPVLRRLLGLVLFIPVHIISLLLFFPVALLYWLAVGDKWTNITVAKGYKIYERAFKHPYAGAIIFLRFTDSIFFDIRDGYKLARRMDKRLERYR